MSLPAAFGENTPYGTVPINNELVQPLLDSTDETKQLVPYGGGSNVASEVDSALNSPCDDLSGYPNDFLHLPDVFGDSLFREMQEIPEVKEEKIQVPEMIAKKDKIVPRVAEAMHQGPSQRSNAFRGQEQVTQNKFVTNQQLPLGRGNRNQRAIANNSSQVNGEMRSFTQIIYSTQNQSSGIVPKPPIRQVQMVKQDDYRVKKMKSVPIEQQSNFHASYSLNEGSSTDCMQHGMMMNPGSMTNAPPMNADITQWNPEGNMRSTQSNCMPKTDRVEAAEIPGQYALMEPTCSQQIRIPSICMADAGKTTKIPKRRSLMEPTFNHQPRLSRRRHVSPTYTVPKVVKQFPNVVHREGSYFYATTSCETCNKSKEHTLYRAGHWPPNQCSNCGGKCIITEWQHFATDTSDDVVFLGEFIASPQAKIHTNNVNAMYAHTRVKVEPVEEMFNAPTCQQCGGHHVTKKGGGYNDFCPHYGPMGNISYATNC